MSVQRPAQHYNYQQQQYVPSTSSCPYGSSPQMQGVPPGGGKPKFSIQQIRELELETVNVEENYQVIREIGSGDYGKVILGVHRKTKHEVALKAVPKITTPIKDFLTEFHYSYFLSPHPAILDTYDVAFQTDEHYFFASEIAHHGDLWNVLERTNGGGLDEKDVKIVCEQIAGALDFMHEHELVHRDVRAENILIFSQDLRRVKLTDFGLTRRAGTLVTKRTRSLPTCPPEIWEAVKLERYTVELGSDCWQMGMLIFALLTTKFPWERADIVDPRFRDYVEWQKRKTTRTPKEFRRFTPRLLRLFRRYMEVKPTQRYPIMEVKKYMKDRWLMRGVKGQAGSPRSASVLKLTPGGVGEQVVTKNFNGSNNLVPPDPPYVGHAPGTAHLGVSRSLSCSHLAAVGRGASGSDPALHQSVQQPSPLANKPTPPQAHYNVSAASSDPLSSSQQAIASAYNQQQQQQLTQHHTQVAPPYIPATQAQQQMPGYAVPYPQQYPSQPQYQHQQQQIPPYNYHPQHQQQQIPPQYQIPSGYPVPGPGYMPPYSGAQAMGNQMIQPLAPNVQYAARSPRPTRRQTVYHSSTSRAEY